MLHVIMLTFLVKACHRQISLAPEQHSKCRHPIVWIVTCRAWHKIPSPISYEQCTIWFSNRTFNKQIRLFPFKWLVIFKG